MSNQLANIKSIIPVAIAITATYSVGLFGLYNQPQLLIPLMEKFNATDPDIGLLYTVENVFYFLSILLSTIPVSKYSRTQLALMGSVLLVMGNVASAYAGDLTALMFYRVIVSIGAGLISAAGTATASAAKDPERAFAMSGVVYLLIFAASHAVFQAILSNFGIKGIYLCTAAYSTLVIPAFFLLQPPIKGENDEPDFFKSLKAAPYRLLAILAMAGLFIYELGQNAVFTYMDKLGDNAGIEADERGMTQFKATVFGLLGGLLATWMGNKYGRFKPLMAGLTVNIIASAMFTIIDNKDYYFYLMAAWDISYSLLMPYLMSTLASLDKHGRWAVAGDAFWNFASTPGPIIATLIVVHGGYNPLAIWVLTCGAIGMTMFCYTARKSDQLGLEE